MFKLALMTGLDRLIWSCPSRDCLSGQMRFSLKVKKVCPLTSIFSQALMQYHLTCSIAWCSKSTWSWVSPQFPLPINRSKVMGISKKTNFKWYNGPIRPNWYLKDISPQNNEFHLFLKCTQNILQDRSHPVP